MAVIELISQQDTIIRSTLRSGMNAAYKFEIINKKKLAATLALRFIIGNTYRIIKSECKNVIAKDLLLKTLERTGTLGDFIFILSTEGLNIEELIIIEIPC